MSQTIVPISRASAQAAAPVGLRPYAAIVAVLLGAMISTLTSRLTSLGLADIRGALGISFDQGAWINTAFSATQMFIGPIAIWAAFIVGTRRILLSGAVVFLIAQVLLPLSPNFTCLIFIQAVSGLASGVFVPVTVGFITRSLPPRLIPFGIAAYAMNLEMSLNISATLEGWYNEHLSWHWLFWQNAVLTIPFIFFLLLSMPSEPIKAGKVEGDYLGMLLGGTGFVCIFVALDQGERLFWLQSPFITVLLYVGLLLLAAFFVRELISKSPGIALSYFLRPNVALLVILTCLIRYTVLNTSFIPSIFLSSIHGLRPLEVGETLRWIAIPQIICAPCVAFLLLYMDARRVILISFCLIAFAFALGSQITTDWAEADFIPSQLIQALGQTMALTSIIFFFAKHITAEHALTFGAILQTTRLFGGQLGTTSIAVAERISEQVHSNVLGLHVNLFDAQAVERISTQATGLGLGFFSGQGDPPSAVFLLLDRTIRVQATTLALADSYRLAVAAAIAGIFITLLLRRVSST